MIKTKRSCQDRKEGIKLKSCERCDGFMTLIREKKKRGGKKSNVTPQVTGQDEMEEVDMITCNGK